jgi:hypothetical protein
MFRARPDRYTVCGTAHYMEPENPPWGADAPDLVIVDLEMDIEGVLALLKTWKSRMSEKVLLIHRQGAPEPLLKKRVARAGQGKSGGFRTLVATNKGSRWFFMYGFTKNQRSNIDKDEEEALKKLAVQFLSLTEYALGKAEQSGELVEVNCDAEDKISSS